MPALGIRTLLLLLSASTATVNLFMGAYMDELQFCVKIVQQISHFISAKQAFNEIVHEDILPWPEPAANRGELFADEHQKVIWGYWHQGEDNLPGFCQLAVESWRVHHPTWEVVILSDANFHQYISASDIPSTFHSLKIQHRSDIIRLAVMKRYGGLYLDVSYVLMKGMDDLWDRSAATGDMFITAPLSILYKGENMAIPNNALILAVEPQNPFFVAWHASSLAYLENPAFTVEGMQEHPVLKRVAHHIADPNFGPLIPMAPYICNLWTMADTLYYEESVASYVAQHVYVLPTLLWTFDFVMVELPAVAMDEVYSKVYRAENWQIWLRRIPMALKVKFNLDEKEAERLAHLGNAMKVSSDFSLDFNRPLSYHASQPTTTGSIYRKAIDTARPIEQADAKGATLVKPFVKHAATVPIRTQ